MEKGRESTEKKSAEKAEKEGSQGGKEAHGHAKGFVAGKAAEWYERQIAELSAIAQEHKGTLQRLQAEFENAAKRADREKDEFRKFASSKAVESFLPLMDSIDEAIKQAEKTANREMKGGLEMIKRQLEKILESNGVKRIEALGKKFDHALHEVLTTGKDYSNEDEIVVEEFQKGYTQNGRVLRPAKVRVNKKD